MNHLMSLYYLLPLALLLAVVWYGIGRGGGGSTFPWIFWGGGDSSGPPSGSGDGGSADGGGN